MTRSDRPGLFQCYASSDLPRTNNDLEHAFGSHRYHERHASGRRRASPGWVAVGSARVISSLATRLRPEEGLVLRPGYVSRWRELRADLEARRESRRRFRHDPASYLSQGVGAAVPPATFASLEKNIIKNARPGSRRFPGIPASSRRERELFFGSRKSAWKHAAYAASKFAVLGFAQSLALELAPHRIHVNSVCPGVVHSERLQSIAQALDAQAAPVAESHARLLEERAAEIPLGRIADPTEIANAVAFLMSSESDYMTGTSILVSGGTVLS